MNVLVVDDEAIARNFAAHVLEKAGYVVHKACNGREALEFLMTERCQLVVSDWEMPEVDGIELCRAIRNGNARGYTYFIMLTSHSQPFETIEGLEAGADDYVSKPFNPAELIMRVNTGRRIIGLETRDMAIFTMAKLAESRDPDTGEHLERVRNYSRCLANRLLADGKFFRELDRRFVELIYETSPLHDIGKVAIPDKILLKPGKLTSQEFDIMKTHTIEGARTLQAALDEYPNASFLKMAHDIAISHHEKFDGTGYPFGLAGDDIPLCGRIVAVADVYDALTSKRVYKDEFTHDSSSAIIAEGAGAHFDETIVDAFFQSEDEFQEIRLRYNDTPDLDGIEERPTLVCSG